MNIEVKDLRNSDLRHADLSTTNLSGTDLSGSNLSGTNLSGANMRGVMACSADLHNANLAGANLSGADLSEADLSCASLISANMSDAKLNYVNISGTIGNMSEIRSMQLSKHQITFTCDLMCIGKIHRTVSEWMDFDDSEISSMGIDMDWWGKWKEFIFTAIKFSAA